MKGEWAEPEWGKLLYQDPEYVKFKAGKGIRLYGMLLFSMAIIVFLLPLVLFVILPTEIMGLSGIWGVGIFTTLLSIFLVGGGIYVYRSGMSGPFKVFENGIQLSCDPLAYRRSNRYYKFDEIERIELVKWKKIHPRIGIYFKSKGATCNYTIITSIDDYGYCRCANIKKVRDLILYQYQKHNPSDANIKFMTQG